MVKQHVVPQVKIFLQPRLSTCLTRFVALPAQAPFGIQNT